MPSSGSQYGISSAWGALFPTFHVNTCSARIASRDSGASLTKLRRNREARPLAMPSDCRLGGELATEIKDESDPQLDTISADALAEDAEHALRPTAPSAPTCLLCDGLQAIVEAHAGVSTMTPVLCPSVRIG
eukprot:6182022-Pleurochrysis_carterae.AAC.3